MLTRAGMGLGLGMGPRPGDAVPWTPDEIVSAGWWDPSDLATLWADVARTTPAEIDGPVLCMDDKSGNGRHLQQPTEASAPILRQSGGLTWLEHSDHFMQTAAACDLSAYNKLTIITAVRKEADTVGVLLELSSGFGTSGNIGTFVVGPRNYQGNSGTRWLSAARGGTSANPNQAVEVSGYAGALTDVLATTHDIAGDLTVLRISGVEAGRATGDKGTGNFAPNRTLYLGKRAGTSLPFVGRFYGALIVGDVLPDNEIARGERYYADKAGLPWTGPNINGLSGMTMEAV